MSFGKNGILQAVKTFDAIVIGAGPVGLVTTNLMCQQGLRTALIAPGMAVDDPRTTALMRSSINLLKHLNAWNELEKNAAPLSQIRLIDDTGQLFKAPTVDFDSKEIGGGPFAYNICNSDLNRGLRRSLEDKKQFTFFNSSAEGLEFEDGYALVCTDAEKIKAPLIIAADGKNSIIRNLTGIDVKSSTLNQSAIVFSFSHENPHDNISTEFHRPNGPLVTVPLTDNCSSVVWVEDIASAKTLSEQNESDFMQAFHDATYGFLGKSKLIGYRGIFPLTNMMAEKVSHKNVALVGEAAHVMPPIGAQGLNLGFRDAAQLAEIVSEVKQRDQSLDGVEVCNSYQLQRQLDIKERSFSVNLMNRSLLTDFIPFQAARSAGLFTLSRFSFARKAMMNYGMQPVSNLPRSMIGDV